MKEDDKQKILIAAGVVIFLAVLAVLLLPNLLSPSQPSTCANSQFGFCNTNPNFQLQQICYKLPDGTEKCETPIPISAITNQS